MPAKTIAIWTRNLDAADNNGRLKTLRSLRRVVQACPDASELAQNSLFEVRGMAAGLLAFMLAVFTGLLRGKPVRHKRHFSATTVAFCVRLVILAMRLSFLMACALPGWFRAFAAATPVRGSSSTWMI